MQIVHVRNLAIGEGMPKICVPIVGRTKEELLVEAALVKSSSADLVEWRMDHFADIDSMEKTLDMLKTLRTAIGDVPILATFRSRKEGGNRELCTADYVSLNKAVIESKAADIIDVELFTGEKAVKQLVALAHEQEVKVIMSNHDFEKTPSCCELLSRLQKMRSFDADLLKIAVMPKCRQDVLTLLSATNEMQTRYGDRPIVTMSMGSMGVISRVCGEVFGSSISFGALQQASAPGQMQAEDLKQMLMLLHKGLDR